MTTGHATADHTGDIILEARGLTMELKGFVVVKEVNLQVRRGTIHALIGPNGAGKSTVFNLLTRFLTPTRGQIQTLWSRVPLALQLPTLFRYAVGRQLRRIKDGGISIRSAVAVFG